MRLRGDSVFPYRPISECLAGPDRSYRSFSCPERQRATFHIHKRLFLLLSRPLPTSAPLPHPSQRYLSCLRVIPASLLSTIPPISFHERHMLPSPSVRSGTQRDGIPSSQRWRVSGSALSPRCRPVHARPRRSKSRAT